MTIEYALDLGSVYLSNFADVKSGNTTLGTSASNVGKFLRVSAQGTNPETYYWDAKALVASDIPDISATKITSGTLPDARIQASGVTQHESSIDHDALTGFVTDEHINWKVSQSSNIHANNYTNTSQATEFYIRDSVPTTYTIGHGKYIKFTSSGSNSPAQPTLSGSGTDASPYTLLTQYRTYATATTSSGGLMSSGDKTKLDGIETGATADQDLSGYLTKTSPSLTASTTMVMNGAKISANSSASATPTAQTVGTAGQVLTSYGSGGGAYWSTLASTTTMTLWDGDTTNSGQAGAINIADKHIKFVEGSNIDINYTGSGTGAFDSPYNLTFAVTGLSTSNWDTAYTHSQSSHSYLPLSGGTMTGTLAMGSNDITGTGDIGGTLTTASQPNITSVGSLTSLTTSGEALASYSGARFRATDGTSSLVMGLWDGVNNRIESANRSLLLTTYSGTINLGLSGGTTMAVGSGVTLNGSLTGTSATFSGDVKIDKATPYLKLSANANDDSIIRMTENDNWEGGFIKYDGNGNSMIIGVHDGDNKTSSSDNSALSIARANGNATFGGAVTVNNSSHSSLAINSPSDATAAWTYYKQNGTLRWATGREGNSTNYQIANGSWGVMMDMEQDGDVTFAGAGTFGGGSNENTYGGVTINHGNPSLNLDATTGSGWSYVEYGNAGTTKYSVGLRGTDNKFYFGTTGLTTSTILTLDGSDQSTTFAGQITGSTSGSGRILNEASSATNPTLNPRNDESSTGIGGVGANVYIITNGSTALTVDSAQDTTFGGVALGVNGSATAPSFSWDSDKNTGMYRTQADHIGFTTAGTKRVEIASDGGLYAYANIYATSDVVAYYSDSRLKDFHGVIENPLDKVMQLNGYYFTENAKAKELGFDNDRMQVGVSAQEIEEVLPELIKDAPIGHGYKTIDYGKITPLLIECIKDQQKQINQLKKQIGEA
jgi:hypothetical protein